MNRAQALALARRRAITDDRTRAGWSAARIARELGVSTRTVIRYRAANRADLDTQANALAAELRRSLWGDAA